MKNKNIVKIGLDTSKKISKKKTLKEKEESEPLIVSPSFQSDFSFNVQKKGKKVFGGLISIFKKKKSSIPNLIKSTNASKDELAILQDEITEKMNLLKKRIEDKKKKAEIERQQNLKKEEALKKDNKQVSIGKKTIYSSINQKMVSSFPSSDFLEIKLVPEYEMVKFCEKCGKKMKKKWVKFDENENYVQEFFCKNKGCENFNQIKKLEIKI